MVQTASIAAGSSASVIATAIAKALTADAALATPKIAGIATAVAVDNKVVVTYDSETASTEALLDPDDGLLKLGSAASGAATFDATQKTTAITGGSGLALTSVTKAASTSASVSVTINGTTYAADSAVAIPASGTDSNVFSSLAPASTASANAAANAAVDTIAAKINQISGGTLTATAGNENGELLITSNAVGNAITQIAVTQGATTLSTVQTADEDLVTPITAKKAAGAVAQQTTISIGSKIGVGDTLDVYIGGADYGTIVVGSGDTNADVATSIAAIINGVLGVGSAVAASNEVIVTAQTAGVGLPDITVDDTPLTIASSASALGATLATYLAAKGVLLSGSAIASSETVDATEAGTINTALKAIDAALESVSRANATVSSSTSVTSVGDATVSASAFSGSEQIWLKGNSNTTDVTGIAATQTLGFSGVTSMANAATFGATVTSGNVAVIASGGTLTTSGAAMTSLNISGASTAGTAGLVLADATTLKVLTALNVATSGSTYVNASGLSTLKTITSTGAGALVVKGSSANTTITTGAGADRLTISTGTVKDNEATSTDETVSAVLSSGAGNDTVKVATTGTGTTTVDTGDGNDTVYYDGIGSGLSTIDLGAGNDTLYRGASSATVSVNGGAGEDTLVRAIGGTYSAANYISDNAVYSNFEAITFTDNVTVDMSKLDIGTITTLSLLNGTDSNNSVTEVSQTVNITGRNAVAAASADGATPSVTATGTTGADLYSAGYEVGSAAVATNFGGALTVNVNSKAGDTVALDLFGKDATVNISNTYDSAADTDGNPETTIAGNLQTVTVNLTSSQATGATAVKLGGASLAKQEIAKVTINAAQTSGASPNTQATDGLNSLQSITISGQGTVVVVADSNSPLLATGVANTTSQLTALTTIDVSGMTDMAQVNYLGLQVTDDSYASVTYGYKNLSTTDITLNTKVAETVKLGGARDLITTSSTIAATDTVIGFVVTGTVADATVIDTAKSDVLELGSFTYNAATAFFTKLTDSYATKNAGMTAAAAETSQYVVFHADGNTYAYIDSSNNGLDDTDLLVELAGVLDLALLIQEGVII